MTDLATLMGGSDRTVRPVAARGRIVRPPVSLTDDLTVRLLNYSAAYEYEVPAAQWSPRGITLPLADELCLVTFDDDGDAWVEPSGVSTFPADGGGAGDETDPVASAALAAHAADTTAIHGIADTSLLVVTTDPRLSDARAPTAHTHDDRYFTEAEVTTALAAKQDAATAATDAELATHAADTTAVHGIADTAALVLTSDTRLTNARTPTAHHASHEPGGSDAMAVDAVAATGSLRTLGTGAQQAAAGNDSRLTNARTPTAHASSHQPGGSDAMAVDAAAGTGSLRTLGTAATAAAAGNRGLPAGGTAGQVLTKGSATDYDAAWAAAAGGSAALPDAHVHTATADLLAAAVGTYMLALAGGGTAFVSAGAGTAKAAFYIDAARYAVAGKTSKLSMRATVVTNAVASGRTFNFNLCPVTNSATASGAAPGVTIGLGIAGFSIVSPAASSIVTATSADITMPASGLFVMVVAVAGGAMAAGSSISVLGQLFARFV